MNNKIHISATRCQMHKACTVSRPVMSFHFKRNRTKGKSMLQLMEFSSWHKGRETWPHISWFSFRVKHNLKVSGSLHYGTSNTQKSQMKHAFSHYNKLHVNMYKVSSCIVKNLN